MALAIKVENVSKAYRLGEIGTGTLMWDIQRWYARFRGKDDPFLKLGETNDRTTKGKSNIVWSLKDTNFEVEEGDAIGIIGRNGAGKSTLLKILSRVTSPTTGSIKLRGRVASLLEVGTGFHPELTGRENVFLNGAILGMRKKEIINKFDEIVDFAGVERYIDTPVKRYSSGMYVRLAFAVAAYLESEILIVDEVLAVGDAEFQRKCLGKMQDVSEGEGKTIVFVSHNMEAIESLTQKCIYLKHGEIAKVGETKNVVGVYLSDYEKVTEIMDLSDRSGDGRARVSKMRVYQNGHETSTIKQGESFDVLIGVNCNENLKVDMSFVLENYKEQPLFCSHLSDYRSVSVRNGYYEVLININVPHLRKGEYLFSMALFRPDWTEFYDVVMHFPIVNIEGSDHNNEFPQDERLGNLYYPIQWNDISMGANNSSK